MQPLHLIHLAALVIATWAWMDVYVRGYPSRLRTAFLWFCGFASAWLAADIVSNLVGVASYPHLRALKPMAWGPVGFLFLGFAYAMVGRRRDLIWYASAAVVALCLPLMLATDLVESGYREVWWGVQEIEGPLFLPVALGAVAGPTLWSAVLLTHRAWITRGQPEAGAVRVIAIASIIIVGVGLNTDVIAPSLMGIEDLPELASASTGLLMGAVLFAVRRHDLMLPPTGAVAVDLLQRVQEGIVFLLSGVPTHANPAACHFLPDLVLGEAPPPDLVRGEVGTTWEVASAEHRLSVSRSRVAGGGQIVVIRDVSGRWRAEEALRDREERYRSLFDSVLAGILVYEAQSRARPALVEVNDVACRMLGYGRQELLSLDLDDLVAPEERGRVLEAVRTLTDEAKLETELRHRTRGRVPVELTLRRLVLGERPSLMLTVLDRTERRSALEQQRHLEAQLRQSQKMEAIGTLAGGMAHDMNNVLGAIMAMSSAVRHQLPDGDERGEELEAILDATRRGQDLTRNLLGFARRGKVVQANTDLNTLVRDVVEILKRTIPKKIRIKSDLDPSLGPVHGDPGLLQHALLNVALNAVDAMDGEGQLTFRSRERDVYRDGLVGFPEAVPGRYVSVDIVDTGRGMPQEVQERVFEPFFTTREEGTGLGLAMVYGTVTDHGGIVRLASVLGQGTTISLLLPRAIGQVAAPRKAAPALTHGLGEGARVLFVDDERLMRRAGSRLLESLGFEVVVARHGAQAVEIYRARDDRGFDIVILDMIMPVMDGPETFKRLMELDPEVRVLVASGWSREGQADELLRQGAAGFVQKPFDGEALVREIGRALSA